ncbi:MAG TPA: SCO family protein [Polyangiaceae bacterium]
MTRRTLLVGLAAASALAGAGVSTAVFRKRGAENGARIGQGVPHGDRSIYALDSRWTTDDGRIVRLGDLRGRIQLLAMMFTSCPSVCPTFVREMQTLDRGLPAKLRDHMHYVLVSIDPEHDTPEALHRYREKMHLDERWTLLRGDARDVRELAQVVGVAYAKTEGAEIAHTRLVTVLDPSGEVVHQQTGVSEDRDRLIAGIGRADTLGAG